MPLRSVIDPIVAKRVRLRALRYALALLGPLLALASLLGHGLVCWALPIYGFMLIPLLELVLPPEHVSLSEEEEAAALKDRIYDFILYLFVPVQYGLLILFFFRVNELGLSGWDLAGRVLSMGIMCGVYGINIAHELGHRAKRWERDLSRAMLLTSLYMHFIIEHNRGHHRRVGTPEDPASARFRESIYVFWPRTILFSFVSAWKIEAERWRIIKHKAYGIHNEMIRSLLIEAAVLFAVDWFFGAFTLACFLAAALIGVLLLESVNYIEHYGLARPKNERGAYGRVQHVHSWNSDHVIGRLMLFELTRHSDHHWVASRKYQVLRGQTAGAMLPTGYPGSIILALVPPLWFRMMDPLVLRLCHDNPGVLVKAAGIAG